MSAARLSLRLRPVSFGATLSFVGIFDDPKQSFKLAMGLGVAGGILVAIAAGISNTPLLIVGIIVLMASGGAWAYRGVKEDQVAAEQKS